MSSNYETAIKDQNERMRMELQSVKRFLLILAADPQVGSDTKETIARRAALIDTLEDGGIDMVDSVHKDGDTQTNRPMAEAASNLQDCSG